MAWEHVTTERLDLRRPDPDGDLEALFGVFSDPAGWWYDPESRHRSPATTRGWLQRAAARFDTDGLSYWTVRRLSDGVVIGVGGAQRQATRAWNLNYRLAGAAQGFGFATELARAAHSAAEAVDPSVPFIAWVAEVNEPSRRVAERLGLTNHGLATDPSDGERRLAYADRPLPSQWEYRWATALRTREADMADDERPRDVHDALNEPATDPDPTEWPDPYDKRPDPRDPGADDPEMDFGQTHTPTGATSTSEPSHETDIEVDPRRANPHEKDRRERRDAG